jgi:uncharacterized protein YndB with AHSA1/START domain
MVCGAFPVEQSDVHEPYFARKDLIMDRRFTAQAKTIIHAPTSKVWQALINPEIIKQYLFNTEVISDWQVGSPIIYRGEWEGKPFEDKGKILAIEPERVLQSTHWSPLSGVPDTPENYHTVTYTLTEKGDNTEVTITQDNNASEEENAHSEKNWQTVLQGMKDLLEG